MDLKLAGKVALVAGASRGAGKAIAGAFAREGARLALCARGRAALDEVARELMQTYGVEVESIACDLRSTTSVQELMQRIDQVFGGVDVVVTNSAPPPRLARFDEIEGDDIWISAFMEQFMPIMRLCRAALPGMMKRGGGRIVNLTSAAVKEFMEHHVLSSTMRMAVTGMAKHLAMEMGPYNIRVNNVCLAAIVTERFERLIAEGVLDRKAREANVPLRRLGHVDELASAVVFLASDASSFITGASLAVEGGQIRAML